VDETVPPVYEMFTEKFQLVLSNEAINLIGAVTVSVPLAGVRSDAVM
jgi:hypothetical protein